MSTFTNPVLAICIQCGQSFNVDPSEYTESSSYVCEGCLGLAASQAQQQAENAQAAQQEAIAAQQEAQVAEQAAAAALEAEQTSS